MTTPLSKNGDTRWYYADANNQPQGPYACEELTHFLATQQINTATLVIKEGDAEWKPYYEVFRVPANETALPPIPLPLPVAPRQQAAASTFQAPVIEAIGVGGSIELFHDRIRITRKGARALMAGLSGDKIIFLSKITAVQFKVAGVMNGYIQFSFPGASTSVRGALQAASDENSMLFDKKQQPGFERIKIAIESYLATGTIESKRQVTASASPVPVDSPKGNNTGCVVALLILFWPIGLLLMWKNQAFSRQTRLVITAIVAVIFGIPLLGGLIDGVGISRIVLFVLMFVCPFGLFRMWREQMFTKNIRRGISGAFAVALCATIAVRIGESSPISSHSSSQSIPELMPKQTQPNTSVSASSSSALVSSAQEADSAQSVPKRIRTMMEPIYGDDLKDVEATRQIDDGYYVRIDCNDRFGSVANMKAKKYNIHRKMMAAYKRIYTSGVRVNRVSISVYTETTDQYGNKSNQPVYQTELSKEVAEKIQWGNLGQVDLGKLWKVSFIIPDLYTNGDFPVSE